MTKPSASHYIINGLVTDAQGKPLAGLVVQAFDQDPSGENPLGEPTSSDEKGAYQITYTDGDFRIEGRESGGADIIVRVYDKEVLLAETPPLRNAGVQVKIDVTVEKTPPEEPQKPILTPQQQTRLHHLREALPNDKLRSELEATFTATKGDWAATLATISQKKPFNEATLRQLEFTNQVAELTEDHGSLVTAFRLNDKTNSLREIALEYNREQFVDFVGKAGIPEDVSEDKRAHYQNGYADKVYNKLFSLEPTAVVQRMVSNPSETPITDKMMSGSVATFLANQPETFNLKTTSVYEALQHEKAFEGIAPELKDGIITEVKGLQRVVALSPVPEALPVLMKSNLTSALQISDMPEAQFTKALSGEMGKGGEVIAKQIHTNAVNARIRNEQALIALKEVGQGTGVAWIDKSVYGGKYTKQANKSSSNNVVAVSVNTMNIPKGTHSETMVPRDQLNEALQKHNLSWDLLFGDADFCECGECTSVYSAAAYFVDLLQYLRHNNLDLDATGTVQKKTDLKDISNTPLEMLFKRRPDLGCLQLTCKNTNTILPYIDLANEVMENYIVYHHPKHFNVEEDETSGELLAQPQHTEYEAYCILHKAVYPFTLPYHQPIDTARIFLDYVGTSRYALLDTFRSPFKEKTEATQEGEPLTDGERLELIQLHEAYLERAVDAEFLGLTQEEYVILTKEAFVSKEYWDKQCKKDHTTEAYLTKVGVKPVPEYYGYATEGEMLSTDESKRDGLTFVKDQLLRRTGLQYTELVDLLKTQCLNPNMPQGKALRTMESLRFSYRYLQTLVDNGVSSPKAKYEKLITLLTAAQPWMPLLEARLQPDPCSTEKVDFCTETNDLENWVYCYFEQVGKIIVLENGVKCVDGEFVLEKLPYIQVGSLQIKIEKCQIIRITSEGAEIPMGSVDKANGLITLNQEFDGENVAILGSAIFISSRGERGKVIVNNGKSYLVNEKTNLPFSYGQADTCDLDTVRLVHLDGTPVTIEEYDHIHRFIRLWRKLGWTISETDSALIGLGSSIDTCCDELLPDAADCTGACDELFDRGTDCGEHSDESGDCLEKRTKVPGRCEITPAFLHQLVSVKKVLDQTGLELIKLLTFWTDISTAGEKSLYKRLFLTHNLLGIDKVFQADKNGNYLTQAAKISEHVPVLMAAFHLSAPDLSAITEDAKLADSLTLAHVSTLYRYRLLAKAIGLRVPDFIQVLPLLGDPFQSANGTLKWLERWSRMEESGFSYRQLNYLIRGFDDPRKPLAHSKKTVMQLAKTLYDGLNTIEKDHKDITTDDLLTTDTVRAKATLLFDPGVVESLVGWIEGTLVFTTNAPKNLVIVLPENKTLKNKLKYDKNAGTIQVTGLLTLAEATDYQALNNDPKWGAALIRIEKQQAKQFKELLFDLIEAEKKKSTDRKIEVEAAENTLREGDIHLSIDQIPEGQEDPNTIPRKQRAFLTLFLSYLRQQLTQQFITDTLSGVVGLERETTRVLISVVLRIGTPATSVYQVFESIKESPQPGETSWSGYLIPAAEAPYTFIVRDSDSKPFVHLDGQVLDFTAQEDPTNEWWSAPHKLQAGKLYTLAISSSALKNVYWKTPTSTIASIPSASLLPDFASQNTGPALTALQKAALLVTGFNLSADEIRYLHAQKDDFGGLDFNQLTFGQWLRLEAYTRLRNALPETSANLLDFFAWTHHSDEVAKLSEKIAELTLWKKDRIDQLVAENHFNLGQPQAFRNEENLLKLQKAFVVADQIGMDIDLLFNWAKPTSHFKKCRTIADSIQKAVRAQYTQEDWEQVVKPLNDQLRNNQRSALIAYLLQQPDLLKWGVIDADGLFEYFLIDVQMDACMETSRIKQALSSVQLFIQRCLLGLEEAHSNIGSQVLDRERWEWMQRYRVWEANRKVFLYPENWIESNLRDDKSPFFKELESELLQKDINKQNVTDALKSYLYKVDEVANMEVVGLHIEGVPNSQGSFPEGSKLHVFARTRNAPYIFYYRYLSLTQWNWYPWEKMQVDVPSYDVEDPNTHQISGNGCYLIPATLNGRLLIFFPQFMKKTKPNPQATGTFSGLANDSNGIEKTKPIQYYEIKMGWSEYRNGKWTQKQLSNNAFNTENLVSIEKFKFFPDILQDKIIIKIEDEVYSSPALSDFEFDGNTIRKLDSGGVLPYLYPAYIPEYFQKNNSNELQLRTWEMKNGDWANADVTHDDNITSSKIGGINFYHPFTSDLLGKINLNQLNELFQYNLSIGRDSSGNVSDQGKINDAFGLYNPDDDETENSIYHELKRPYSLYNWELFFHTPMMLADALSKAQQFEEAMKWYHFVFNPLADGTDDKRFWQFSPFKETDAQNILDKIFNDLKPNKSNQAINEWRGNPFKPHLVARSRPVAYMKWVVMKYIDNLVAWGDYLFRQDTIESINQATQLYVLAGHILGPRPQLIPKRGKIKPQTYNSLLNKWDAFSNAMVELELVAPFSNQTSFPIGIGNGVVGLANVFGFTSSLYFCIPNNPKLMGYWDTIADRLFKIRHCQNMEGVFRKLPLFEPPIDPALLVNAAAQGLSIASVLNDLNSPMPNYRFYYLLQKALELCGELKSMGNGMLSFLEKKDNEALSLLRAKHESTMQNLVMEIKKQQLEEANKALEGLQHNRKSPEHRMKYYLQLIGEDVGKVPGFEGEFNEIANSIEAPVDESGLKLIKYEKEDMDKASEANAKQKEADFPEKLASIMHIIPGFSGNVQPFGIGLTMSFGGSNLGSAAQAWAKFITSGVTDLSFQSSKATKKSGFLRAYQDRVMQANAAGYEIKQIDKQILSQQIRINIANQEITNQQKQIDHSQEVEEFLKNKYTNDELYSWMRGSLKTLYHQVYSLAYELAKKAEKVYRFERGLTTSNFIQAGYWDAGRDGLMAGEQLYVGLKQLETAYQEQRGYDYEVTKHVSLRQVNPLAILQLKETGKCEFVVPEVLFDIDYPGHYKRRIKSVSLSIPCIAGPYTGLNATLRLLENKFRNTAIAKDANDYSEKSEESDERFNSFIIPINAIAASSGQNDSGMFELNFKDERYLPFEGAGAISKWRLELPDFRQFDYDTISDVIMHVRYTANEGGERLKKAANDSVLNFMKTNEELGQQEGLFALIDLKHDLASEWHKAMQVLEGATERTLSIREVQDFLPYFTKFDRDGRPRDSTKLKVTDIVLATYSDLQASEIFIQHGADEIPFTGGPSIGLAKTFVVRDEEIKVGDWQLHIKDTNKPIDKAFMALRFVVS